MMASTNQPIAHSLEDQESKLEDLFERYKARKSSRKLSVSLGSAESSKNLSSSRRSSKSYRSSSSSRHSSESSISDMKPTIEMALNQAASFVTHEQLKLERRGRELLKEVMGFSEDETRSATKLEEFKKQAQDISRASIEINRFAVRSTKAYIDDQGADSASSLLSKTPWPYVAGGTKIVTILSDVFNLLHSIAKDDTANSGQWVAPSSFERYTHKYWVNEEYLSDVMLSCATAVPMLVYGKSGLLTDDLNDEKDRKASKADMKDIWSTMTTPITSIYFDSPGMYLYGHRIARDEGAKLFRVRWYGEKPQGDQLVFCELKTHHEQWIADKSVKQRVSLRERDMTKLLARDGVKWNKTRTEELVLLASPNLKGDDLVEAVDLLHQVRKLIIKRDLRPCVRTRYLRMAFQAANSNELRLTIDRNITMSDESHAPLGDWSLPVEDGDSAESVRVPCAVFEVKLAGSDNPAFMETLLDNGAIQDGHKFSKFLTGAATFNADKVNTLPYWARLRMFKGMFGIEDFDDMESSFLLNKKTHTKKVDQSQCSTTADSNSESLDKAPSRRPSTASSGPVRRGSALSLLSFPRRSSETETTDSLGSKKVAPKKRARVEPKTYFASERTYIQWISAALLLVTIATLLLGISKEEGLDAPRAMSLTLIFTALFVAIYAVFIYFRRLHLLTRGLPYGYADHAGPIILTSAVIMGIIALLYYTFTLNSDQQVVERVATPDSQGNCVRLAFTGVSLLEYQPSDAVLDDTRQTLIIPSQSTLTSLSLAGEGSQELRTLVEAPGTDIEAIAYVGGTVYAVAEKKGSSSLLSFEPQFDGEATRYELVGEWKLKGRAFTEGMAYVPDENGGKFYISDTSEADALVTASNVYIYDIPVPGSLGAEADGDNEIFPVHQLNGKLLTVGIAETPKIGAMTYFEGVLYILHDNARVVRGWDLASGTIVSEWILPRVEGGFNQQWEGLTLQRVSTTHRNVFRGTAAARSTSSVVVLHLALDTPPQIWTFKLQQIAGSTDGKNNYILPECAAAY